MNDEFPSTCCAPDGAREASYSAQLPLVKKSKERKVGGPAGTAVRRGADESVLFQRLDRIAIGRQRTHFFIIFQPPQNWIAAERIRFKLVALLHVRQQVLFDLSEFWRGIRSFLLRHSSGPFAAGLALRFAQLKHWGLGSATHAIPLPQLEPWAVRELRIVPSIRSREVTLAQRSDVRRLEHFL
jgi:hypothetical protein